MYVYIYISMYTYVCVCYEMDHLPPLASSPSMHSPHYSLSCIDTSHD